MYCNLDHTSEGHMHFKIKPLLVICTVTLTSPVIGQVYCNLDLPCSGSGVLYP